jgi:hypothetical protein
MPVWGGHGGAPCRGIVLETFDRLRALDWQPSGPGPVCDIGRDETSWFVLSHPA